MGLLDRLVGRNGERGEAQEPAQPSAELLADSSSSTSAALSSAAPQYPPAQSPVPDLQQGPRLYNPYQGLNAAVSSSGGQQPAYKLPRQPEFLFQEEAAVHRRSWSENLTFYTGSGYLSGAILGGSRGAFEALRVPPPDTALNTTRLRLNRLLNLSGKNGRAAGHTLGVLGLFFSSAESLIGYFNDQSVPEAVNSVAAGALSGALYRAPRGLRTAGVAGGIGAVAASALVYARNNLSKGL